MDSKRVKITSIKNISNILLSSLDNNSHVKLNITGNSMYPLLRNNIDAVILKKKSSISKYDILLYQRDNGDYILHRVVKIKNNVLCMAGDNETEIEFPVYKNQIIASVESFYRNGRHMSCNNLIYKLYSMFWVFVLPERESIVSAIQKWRHGARSRRWKRL